MSVRGMSALRRGVFGPFSPLGGENDNKIAREGITLISPKAEVRGSNPFGRASLSPHGTGLSLRTRLLSRDRKSPI
jgi:hypothetical protein